MRQKLATILEGDTSAGLNGEQLGKLEDTIKRTIAQAVRPDAARFPDELPHEALGRWIRNVERETPVQSTTATAVDVAATEHHSSNTAAMIEAEEHTEPGG